VAAEQARRGKPWVEVVPAYHSRRALPGASGCCLQVRSHFDAEEATGRCGGGVGRDELNGNRSEGKTNRGEDILPRQTMRDAPKAASPPAPSRHLASGRREPSHCSGHRHSSRAPQTHPQLRLSEPEGVTPWESYRRRSTGQDARPPNRGSASGGDDTGGRIPTRLRRGPGPSA
ncbi:unnamed protein product, partial [Urochloa humidicola]